MYDSLSRTFAGIQYVWLGISIFLLVLLLLSRTKIFRNALSQERYTKREYIIFTVIFTILGLCGTFWNFRTPGGIMTFRAVPIMLSGFIGGPIVGTITGLIVGINRIFILQTATAPINGGLSILQGIAAGLLSPPNKKALFPTVDVGLILQHRHRNCLLAILCPLDMAICIHKYQRFIILSRSYHCDKYTGSCSFYRRIGSHHPPTRLRKNGNCKNCF